MSGTLGGGGTGGAGDYSADEKRELNMQYQQIQQLREVRRDCLGMSGWCSSPSVRKCSPPPLWIVDCGLWQHLARLREAVGLDPALDGALDATGGSRPMSRERLQPLGGGGGGVIGSGLG